MTDPLPIATVHVGTTRKKLRAVTSIADATDMLLHAWPQEGRGVAYRAAVRLCLGALEGEAAKAAARNAFIRAALEANLYVRTEERWEPR